MGEPVFKVSNLYSSTELHLDVKELIKTVLKKLTTGSALRMLTVSSDRDLALGVLQVFSVSLLDTSSVSAFFEVLKCLIPSK